jgi:hypothetical protein
MTEAILASLAAAADVPASRAGERRRLPPSRRTHLRLDLRASDYSGGSGEPEPNMAERSDDIDAFDFDFFEEPPTEEAAQRQQPRRRGPRRPAGPPSGLTPLLRLIGLIAFAIAVVLVLVLWVQSCRSDSKREQYTEYNDDVRVVASESAAIGRNLTGAFTTRGLTQAELAKRLTNLAQQQQQGVERAREIDPPGPLREVHESSVDSLQLRAGGLQLLAQTFARAPARGTGNGQGNQAQALSARRLATQMQRLLSSDIVWDDLYRLPARGVLRQEGLFGINVPDSNFLTDPDLATARGMAPLVQRVRGATTGGTPSGTHGNGIVQVRALPGGKVLDEDADNTITLTPELQIEVTVENSGDAQEVQVPVRLTLQQSPEPITKTKVIPVIDPGQQVRVVFGDFDRAQIGEQTQLKVEVEPVQGEENTENNTEQFPVTFLFTPAE